ncbi:hypothetical protein AHAS_Ahas02G0117500 [Arachis hypogaea]
MTQSKKSKLIVEDSSPKQTQSYHGSEIRTEELEEFLRESKKKKNNEKSAAQGFVMFGVYIIDFKFLWVYFRLSLAEESANDPAEQNMMVVPVETQSQTEALSIVSIQVYLPLSKTTPAKSPSEKINEETTKRTPEPPPKPEESTPTLPPTASKINTVSEDVAALMMIAQTASYIPKEGSMPSFILGLTNSSQQEAAA